MKPHADTYKEIKVFEFPNMTIRVHIPELTDVERKRRAKQSPKTAAAMMKSYAKTRTIAG